MKAIHLVLVGLGSIVFVLVLWLQHDDSGPKAESQPQAVTRPAATPNRDTRSIRVGDDPEPAAKPQSGESTPEETEVPSPNSPSLGEALGMPGGFERVHLLEKLGFDAARDSLAAAIQVLAGITGPADRAAFLRGIFARAAQGRPTDAIEAIRLLTPGIDRDTALSSLVANLRPTPVPLETQRAMAEHLGAMGSVLAPLLDDPALAAEYARGLLQGMDKARFLSAAAVSAVAKDPQLALSFGEGLQGRERNEFLTGLASGWARSAGDAAWAWSLQEPVAPLRSAIQLSILESWAEKDPQTAASHLAMIADADARKRAIQTVASSWAGADTQAALGWANSLSDPAERDTAAAAISSQAPVGIGVVLRMGEQGYPVIADVVPGGPASATGSLAGGYQIAAVSNGSGGFIDLQNKSMEEITSLIRGKPGTNLLLQVFQPGANPNQRTTVQVPRQQLMFKRPP